MSSSDTPRMIKIVVFILFELMMYEEKTVYW